jgi:ferritin
MSAEVIAHLYEEMCEELDGAEQYAKLALMWKPINSEFSKNFHMMANEELKHAAMMRDMANKEMNHVKDEHKDAIFADEYQRYFGEKFVDKHAKVKQILAEIGS